MGAVWGCKLHSLKRKVECGTTVLQCVASCVEIDTKLSEARFWEDHFCIKEYFAMDIEQ